MNKREETIILEVGKYAQTFAKLLEKFFDLRTDYTGFRYFKISDLNDRYEIELNCISNKIAYIVEVNPSNYSSWTLNKVFSRVSETNPELNTYVVDLLEFVIKEFGSNIHSIVFSMERDTPSSVSKLSSGEEVICWALFKPSDFESYLGELKANEYHYKHLLEKAGNNDPLSFGEAYYFAEEHYNNGGDRFVECTDPRDFERYLKDGYKYTKKSMLKDFKQWKDVCTDRMGW